MGYCYATYEVYFYVNSNVNPLIPRGHWVLTYDRPRGLTGQDGKPEDREGSSDTEDAQSL